MEWLEVHIDTNHAGLEPLEIFLSANGVDGVVIDDEQDFQSFLENNHQYWDYVDEDLEASMKGKSRITFYLPADGDGFDQLAHLRTALQGFKDAHAGKYGTLLMTLENLKDADWENNWKQYYKPMEIGERLLVIPEWEQENVKGQAKYAGKVPLILEPGLTFGTGSHATTRLCLTALEQAVHGGERVLDLGCGSGILSIAALTLGAASAAAVDIDDKCLTVAYENAALNGIGKDRYAVLVGIFFVLCKGGHKVNDADDLLWRNGFGKWFHGKRIDNPNTHGTGCTLSSAIASNLAKGYDLDESVERAKEYISGALAAMLDLGHGSGPMNHMFALKGAFTE